MRINMSPEIKVLTLLGILLAAFLWINVLMAAWVYNETLTGQGLVAFALSALCGKAIAEWRRSIQQSHR